MAQVRGIREKARAMLVSSAISANILFITPMLPFSAPARNRLYSVECINDGSTRHIHLKANVQNDRDNPNRIVDIITPRIPPRRTGLRPMESESRLHCNTVVASPAK